MLIIIKRSDQEVFGNIRKFCCKELVNQWAALIGFGCREPHPKYPMFSTNDDKMNLYERQCYDDDCSYEEHPINFCPFCGEKFEYKEANDG